MTPTFAMACTCGRTISAACPSVSDITTVMDGFTGWGFDDRGHVRCPVCLAAPVETSPVPQTAVPGQGNLFAEVA